MGGIKSALQGLVDAFGVPSWVVLLIGALVVAYMIRSLFRSAPVGRARALVTRASFAGGDERQAMEDKALQMVTGHPDGLIAVATEALKRGRPMLAREAIDQLRATGRQGQELRRLELLLEARPLTPQQEALAIRNLLAEGLQAQARAKLTKARGTWPRDEELAALERELS